MEIDCEKKRGKVRVRVEEVLERDNQLKRTIRPGQMLLIVPRLLPDGP